MLFLREYLDITSPSQLRPGDIVKLDYPYIRGTRIFRAEKPHYAIVINPVSSMRMPTLFKLTHLDLELDDLDDPEIKNNPLILTRNRFKEVNAGDTDMIFKNDYQGSVPAKIFTPLFLEKGAKLNSLKIKKLGYIPNSKSKEAYNRSFRQKYSTNNFDYLICDKEGKMHLFSRKGNKDVEYDKKGKVIQESCLDEQISLFDKYYVLFFVPLKESEIK